MPLGNHWVVIAYLHMEAGKFIVKVIDLFNLKYRTLFVSYLIVLRKFELFNLFYIRIEIKTILC